MWKWMMRTSEKSDAEWIRLARLYLEAAGGRYLPGMVHNANNACHIIAMATELLRVGNGTNLCTKLDKIAGADSELQALFGTVECRSLSLSSTTQQVHIPDVVRCELDFFQNCLFFKHNVRTTVSTPGTLPPVALPPMALLYCFEAGLANAVEACESTGSAGVSELNVTIAGTQDAARISVTSPTTLPPGMAPFSPKATSKPDRTGMGLTIARNLCAGLGWTVSLTGGETSTTYILDIPFRECAFSTIEQG